MDSVSHIRVANLLMDYVEQTCGVTFDPSGFVYGNLKPDLTGTYLTAAGADTSRRGRG